MQIVPFEKEHFAETAKILSLCMQNPQRELSEYMQNPAACIFTALSKQKPVGVICLLQTVDSADLLDVAVAKEYRRKKVATKLVLKAFEICRQKNITEMFLEVRQSNFSAIALYESLGFEKISVRKKYYTAPVEDAIIYRRKI